MNEQPVKSTEGWAPVILGSFLTVGIFAVLVFVLTQPVPQESVRIIDMIIGSILTQWVMAMGYFFGTTSSSAKKTELLAKAEPIKE